MPQENTFTDTALDDFMSRFGDKDPNKKMSQNFQSNPARTERFGNAAVTGADGNNISGAANPNLVDFAGLLGKPMEPMISNDKPMELMKMRDSKDIAADINPKVKGEGLAKAGGIATSALSVAPTAISMVKDFKGDSFDTSAEGGGPGSESAAIMGRCC